MTKLENLIKNLKKANKIYRKAVKFPKEVDKLLSKTERTII